ncbi:DUF3857 domain-containing protein [Paraburkholderia flava]|uniref:DUF3857 domain-containing protein n=1 Tax=Paraburkholderia flava TaxID=2547393 RepID=UPI001F0E44F7|nr:DUF3857 domain-containing protein [Paraburkholderia flava]
MPMFRKLCVAGVTSLVGLCIHAQAATSQPNITSLSNDIDYTINADGTFVKTVAESFRIETEQGVKEDGQVSLSYSTSLQRLDIEEAYVTTPAGKRIDVAPGQILEQQSAQGAQAPMFDDNKVKVVVFPGVTVGATLTLHYRRTQKRALFPGQFAATEYFSDRIPRDSMRLTVHAPAALPLHVDAVDLDGGRVGSTDAGGANMQQWQWTLTKRPARAPELDSISVADHSPRVSISSFTDFAAVAAAYQQRARPKSAVTPAVQALADQLTKGVSDPRQQAEILYDWVSTHIRYVAIYFGFGGVVPHDADTILSAAYGDCKDHVALLEALLAAKGIASAPVLVNAGNTYWLPTAADPVGVFDHAITYLPAFKLFVDSTTGTARFGVLPPTLLGKQALVTDDGTGSARVERLPLATPDNARVTVTTRIMLDRDGNATGTAHIDSTGVFDWYARQLFASIRPGLETQVAARILTLTGQDGTGDYRHDNVQDLSKPFDYDSQFVLPDYAQFPGPGAIRVPLGLGSFSNIGAVFDVASPETRTFAIPFVAQHLAETTAITLPDGIRIPQLPKPADIESPFGRYTSLYRTEGSTITVTRTLVLSASGPLIEPAQYPAFRQFARAVKRDLRTQLVY